jgi:RHS repeat-associated protein
VHDALGRRVGKVVGDGVTGVLQKGWRYGMNSLQPLAQLDSAGRIEKTFVYGTRVNVPELIIDHVSGATYRIIVDHLGSVRLIVNVATGAVAQQMAYDEFGNVTANVVSLSGFSQPFGFAGGLYDADTGLVRFGARDYDTATGRWTAKDPIGFAGGDANLYAYCGSDPVNCIDPTGLRWPTGANDLFDNFIIPGERAVEDFFDNYDDMREANTIGADRYFHCMANCEAARRGDTGTQVSEAMSEARELFDEHVKDDPADVCNADRQANDHGRDGGRNSGVPCDQVCAPLRPNGLDPRY